MPKHYSEEKYPLISFIMPVYGDAHTVEEAANSIMSQDYPNVELILSVDGCKESEKAVRKIVQKYAKGARRCEALYAQKNQGACIARNEGAKLAKGKYFSFLPADAKLFPGVVRVWMRTLEEHADYDFLYGGYRFRQEWLMKGEVEKMAKEAGKTFAEFLQGSTPAPDGRFLGRDEMNYYGDAFDPYTLEVSNYIDGSFPLKATKFWEVGGWDPKIKSLQDWDLWLSVVKSGGKGLYIRDIFFDTEYPHAGGLSDDSARNWVARTREIKKKHGIPDRKICVSAIGAPFHGKRIARILDADYKEMPSFKPHAYEMVYLLGFYPSFADISGQVFIGAKGKRVIHWIGSDIWQMQQADLRTRHTLLSYFENNIDVHLCEAEFTRKELKELGIDAKVVPLPPRFFYEKTPLPKKFTVAVYMPTTNQGFYLPDICKKITELMPDVEFKFFGDNNNVGRIGNLEYKGFVSDMQTLIDECSAILRLAIHDGLPLSVIEFISAGRHALTSAEMKFSTHALTPKPEAIVAQLRVLQKKVQKEGFNEVGAVYYRRLCSHKRFKKTMEEIATYDPKAYWDKRAEVWSKQADAQYSLSQGDLKKIKTFLKSVKFSSVIDLGCGNGRFVPLFEGKEYTGLDVAKKLITIAKQRYPKEEFLMNSIENLGKTKRKFDLAFSFTALEHIPETSWTKTIEGLKKVAKFGVFIEPVGFESVGHCHAHAYAKDLHVIKSMRVGDKTLFFVDLQKTL